MNASERRKQIIEALCQRRYDTVENLAFEFGVNRKTILNDVLELSLSYPIYSQKGRYNGGIYIDENYYLGRQFLTDSQKSLLETLKGTVDDAQAKILQSIIDKFAKPERKVKK